MKKLIINADDLGISRAVNRGIEIAHRHGAVSSASLLANFPAFDDGVRIAKTNPALGIGIHLNLIRGVPVTSPEKIAPLLTEKNNGRFFGNFWWIGWHCSAREYLAAAEIEYRAQIEKVIAAGITPDHLDFEKHHGIWRPLYQLGNYLASEYRLAIRGYNEPLIFTLRKLPGVNWRAALTGTQLYFYQKMFHHGKWRNAPTSNFFFGQQHIGAIDEKMLNALMRNLPDGISELMCHPGDRDLTEESTLGDIIGKSWITDKREPELAALTARDWAQIAAQNNVELTTFAACK